MIAFADKTDQELAADARMLAQALGRVRTELASRGIEVDILSYNGTRVEVDIERVTREKL